MPVVEQSVQILANIESPNRAGCTKQDLGLYINLKHTTAQRLIEVFMIISILAPAPSANKRKNMARAAESEIHGDGLNGEDGSTYIWVILRCWGNSSMVEGQFSKWL